MATDPVLVHPPWGKPTLVWGDKCMYTIASATKIIAKSLTPQSQAQQDLRGSRAQQVLVDWAAAARTAKR